MQCIHLLPIKASLLMRLKALEMSTLLRRVYCFPSQGKLENEFLWAVVECSQEGVGEGGQGVGGSVAWSRKAGMGGGGGG